MWDEWLRFARIFNHHPNWLIPLGSLIIPDTFTRFLANLTVQFFHFVRPYWLHRCKRWDAAGGLSSHDDEGCSTGKKVDTFHYVKNRLQQISRRSDFLYFMYHNTDWFSFRYTYDLYFAFNILRTRSAETKESDDLFTKIFIGIILVVGHAARFVRLTRLTSDTNWDILQGRKSCANTMHVRDAIRLDRERILLDF